MSDGKAALEVPATAFDRPKRPRSTSAQSFRSTASKPEGLRAVTPTHDKSPSADDLKVPPPTPGRSEIHTPPTGETEPPGPGMTTLLAGQSGKAFTVHTDLLCQRSPYFKTLFSTAGKSKAPSQTLSFPDLDEFAFALFVRWLYGAMLSGPSDFHTMQHYLCLYVLASRFQIEKLQNSVMDLVRFYYRSANMTAPPYRLEYVYERTSGRNKMRAFLVSTAAYRMMCEGNVSEAMKGVITKGGDLATDLVEQLVKLLGDGMTDARRGPDCVWHEHVETPVCKKVAKEAYEAD